MDRGLIESTKSLIADAGAGGLGEVLKPLNREIYLFDTYIAGTTYLKDKSVLDTIESGNRLILKREDNRYDGNAILVLNSEGKKLGYVPERDNIVFARLMDAGKLLGAKIKKVDDKGSFKKVKIEIYLIDF